MRIQKTFYFIILLAIAVSSCKSPKVQTQNLSTDWSLHGIDYAETRFSTSSQINKENVASLKLAWSTNLGMMRGIEATPIVVNGVMYLSGPWSTVFAMDALKGKMLWQYDPQVPKEYGEKGCCDVVNRGVAVHEGKVFLGTFDGRLVALNAKNGKVIWEKVTVDQSKPYTITGAPRVINNKVIIGNGGAEYGVRGYFAAYDTKNGNELWRFYTVPGNPSLPFENKAMEQAAKTWNGEWWKYGGGGTVWDAMAFDPELNTLYVGTGNGSPWNRNMRSPGGGDNLYISSILAINPDNGELKWHYQTTPGESWDFTATQHIILADLTIEGKPRKVLMQAPKNGFFYVIDRVTGKFISANNYTYVNWAKGIDPKTGRPIETEFARYDSANVVIAPNHSGGHNWQPMAYNPNTKLVYIPSRETASIYGPPQQWVFNKTGYGSGNGWNVAVGFNPSKPIKPDPKAKNKGFLLAWNPINQKEVWRVDQNNPWSGGLMATTSNLLFQGNADGNFNAFDAENGKLLWSANLQSGIIASPITYKINGKQYVTIVTGWGGIYGMKYKHTDLTLPGAVYTFALDGKLTLPEKPQFVEKKLISKKVDASPQEVLKGQLLFLTNCVVCHVVADGGGGIAPDLAYSSPETHEIFTDIVLEGYLLQNGMPKFKDRLSKEDINAIQQFIFKTANDAAKK